ncbi:hypothetical protein Zmor_028459 [Zophobas morio]|uniref:DUF4789 domain-containing protein n=1 Tax=Zophobas morio TaxID=2755281 RepID=A0AA38M4B0_9CUCU|nr:hypothetical protein Zmor_028459 [Zophobas morio]
MNKFHSLLLLIVIIGNNCQAYPSLEDKEYERVPMFAPDKCPENQLLYPGKQINDDWICDCGPGYIYYPPVDSCFGAYRQGPCPQTYHLILKPDKVVSECVVNPCEEGFASYEGVCYELDKPDGPCAPAEFGGGIFGVNATTLTVECLKEPQKLSLRFYIPPNCPSGSRRDTSNTCREDWNVYPDNRTQW